MMVAAVILVLTARGEMPFKSIYPDKRPPVVVSYKGKKVGFQVPPFARIKNAAYDADKGALRVELRGDLPTTHLGYFSLEAYFDEVKGQKKQSMIALPLGFANYATPGQAWSFIYGTWRPISKLALTRGKDWIQFGALDKGRFGKKLHMVVIRYLPDSFDIRQVRGGASDMIAEVWKERRTIGRGGFYAPPAPPIR